VKDAESRHAPYRSPRSQPDGRIGWQSCRDQLGFQSL
jgi:hypothetical protein